MEGKEDGQLASTRSFTLTSFRLEPQSWREFVSEEDNMAASSSFCGAQESCQLFLFRRPHCGLSASLDFPRGLHTKVICVSHAARRAVTAEHCGNTVTIHEVQGGDVLSVMAALTEEVTCPLLSNPQMPSSWAGGVAKEALRFMERQKNKTEVMKAQVEGLTFLPHPDALCHQDHHDDGHHNDGLPVHSGKQKLSNTKLLHACEGTIIEWAELVSDFLQQDWSRPVLDGLKPLPSEEFDFWKNRLKNLHFIQQQLMSPRAQQVASIVQAGDSVYWSTLRDIYRDVQAALQEVEDVTVNLNPVQEKLEEVQHVEYQQLKDNMAAVMQEVRLLWLRSESYSQPCRKVVLLQEICNLVIHLSRKFLRGQEVMRGLVLDPSPVLDDVRLVIRTLQTLKETYAQNKTLLDLDQKQDSHNWDRPSHLLFLHLDHFLKRLLGIKDVFCVSLQLSQLDQTVLSGVCGRMWSDAVQGVYQDFLLHVRFLSDCTCDPTDPEDQSFELHLDQFQVQVQDLDTRLVSVLGRALEDCSVPSSAAKLVQIFGSVLTRPLIRDQLRPQLTRLVDLILVDLDETELLFHSQKEDSKTFSRFSPMAAAGLCWTRQLRLRAEDALNVHRTVQQLCGDSARSQLVLHRFQQIVNLLQDFSDTTRSSWSSQLDSDCSFILNQPLIQHSQQGGLEVCCSHQVEVVLRGLRYLCREKDVELHLHAAQLFARRDDITQSYLGLTHMVSCYNQVVCDVLQVELPLIQDQLQDLNQSLSELQRTSWSSEGVGVQQQTASVLSFHSTVRQARANMDTMTHVIQGWAELHLLQRSGEALLEGGATEETCKCIREDGQELLRLTQVNRSLYGADESSQSWIRYLDHIDDNVQDGLFQLLLRALHFLSDNMTPQRCSAPLLAIRLQLLETGSVFEPLVGGGLSDDLQSIISGVYAAASLLPRISVSRHGNYQVSLQQNPELCALEQEVMHHLLQVGEAAEHLRAGLDRYSYLWLTDKRAVMQEFLTYSRQLGPEELEAHETPPTLRDFQREIQSLHSLIMEVTHLDEVIILHSWLQVDLRPFRDSLLSIILEWKHMYTEYLLQLVSDSLQQMTRRGVDHEASSSSSLPLTGTIQLLEAAAVELPEHLAAQLQDHSDQYLWSQC